MNINRLLLLSVVAGAAIVGRPRVCKAVTKVHLLVIGNNQPFSSTTADAAPVGGALRFADDDAAEFYEFMSQIADSGHLLTVMDRETASIYPQLATLARAPSLREVRAAVATLAQKIEKNRAAGNRNVLFVFFSGHGVTGAEGPAALALMDGRITRQFLYDEILAMLPADYVHVFVDACHAEAVVRPRDVDAQAVSVATDDATAFMLGSTLARFPNVGAIVSSSNDAEAHEWDLLGHGVFTHELLSALRGAADVNGDDRIEYSEVYAFLKAANRDVEDPRARLTVVARPPDLDRRVPLVDLSLFPRHDNARLTKIPGGAGIVAVQDGTGRRLASLHGEPTFTTDLMVPGGRTIYVSAREGEARFESEGGGVLSFDDLHFVAPDTRARSALEHSLRSGLFAAEFGRGYYTGVVDEAGEFAPVVMPGPSRTAAISTSVPSVPRASMFRNRWFAAFGTSTAVAQAIASTVGMRLGRRPGDDTGAIVSLDVLRGGHAGLAEWQVTMNAGWAWGARLGRVDCWAGLAGGGGLIRQTAPEEAARLSGLLEGGPVFGVGTRVHGQGELWLEGQLLGAALRRDGRYAAAAFPSVWIGVSLGR